MESLSKRSGHIEQYLQNLNYLVHKSGLSLLIIQNLFYIKRNHYLHLNNLHEDYYNFKSINHIKEIPLSL